MYKREFDQLLTSGPLPKSLLLYGENDYYLDRYARLFIEKSEAGEGLLKLYYDEYDFQSAKNHLGQSSLFGDRNLLMVRSDRKIPKKELTTLLELAYKNEQNYFLYLYTGSDFKSLASSFNKKVAAEHVRFFPVNLREGREILTERAAKLGLAIEPYALDHLLTALNFNLALAVNELEKLSILEGPIGAKEVDEHVVSLAPMAMDEFLTALFSRSPLEEVVTKMHQLGEDEYAVLRAIEYFTTQLFLFHAYIKLHGSPDSAQILGYKLPKQLEQQRSQLAIKIPLPLFAKILDTLAQGELAMKSPAASSQKETLLLAILIKIKSFLR